MVPAIKLIPLLLIKLIDLTGSHGLYRQVQLKTFSFFLKKTGSPPDSCSSLPWQSEDLVYVASRCAYQNTIKNC